jgi:hypothetical protein
MLELAVLFPYTTKNNPQNKILHLGKTVNTLDLQFVRVVVYI